MPSLTQQFQELSLGMRLFVLALIFDPLGAIAGYAFHQQLGVEPIMGVIYGLVAASLIISSYVVKYIATQQSESDPTGG